MTALRRVTLVGDGIENPGNALAMIHAAQMWGAGCAFRDTKGLAESTELPALIGAIHAINADELRARHPRIVACDNLPGASEVYGYSAGTDFGLVVGNERRGLSHECRELATEAVEIPMQSRRVNCLNVAAAAAVALYYLCHHPVGRMAVRREPASRRPELLLVGGADHVELGSTIRSAAAFGWERAFVEDRAGVWFGVDRVTRSEGRAAARRGKNDIRLVPCSGEATFGMPEVTVITTARRGPPINRVNLAGGPRQLVVVADESRSELAEEDWTRLGQRVTYACVDVPAAEYVYHYRLVATIALAEISRQVGIRLPGVRGRQPRPPTYDRALVRLSETVGEVVSLSDLLDY